MLYSEHARAFRRWHVTNLDRTATLWSKPPLASRIIEPRLHKFEDHLKLRIERDDISVAAEYD